jgi:hypothetical protein
MTSMSPVPSLDVYDKVAARELTPEEGAEILMQARQRRPPKKPTWMPFWLYAVGVMVGAIVLAPFLSSRDR